MMSEYLALRKQVVNYLFKPTNLKVIEDFLSVSDRTIKQQQADIKELVEHLKESSELIKEWSSVHNFDDWNRADIYEAAANKYLNGDK